MKKDGILIIEDDVSLLQALAYRFKKEKYLVIAVETGEAGLLALKKQKPDLLILDLVLPGLSGIEILEWLKEHQSSLPVLIYTARFLDKDLLAELKPYAPFEIVQKNGSIEKLVMLVRKALAQKEEPKSKTGGGGI